MWVECEFSNVSHMWVKCKLLGEYVNSREWSAAAALRRANVFGAMEQFVIQKSSLWMLLEISHIRSSWKIHCRIWRRDISWTRVRKHWEQRLSSLEKSESDMILLSCQYNGIIDWALYLNLKSYNGLKSDFRLSYRSKIIGYVWQCILSKF